MTLQEELDEIIQLRAMIESGVFQKRLMKPLMKELDKVKNAYDCKTLSELATVKGKKDGLMFMLKLLKQVNQDYLDKKLEIDNSDN